MFNIGKDFYKDRSSQFMLLGSIFVMLLGAILTISPAVKFHSLNYPLKVDHWVGVVTCLAVFWSLHLSLKTRNSSFDPYILPIMKVIIGWGLITIFRLSSVFGFRQSVWLIICSIFATAFIRYSKQSVYFLRKYWGLIFSLSFFALLLTFIFGVYPGGIGPELWLGCCGIYIQPAEFYKFALILALSTLYSQSADSHSLPVIIKSMFYIVPSLIIFIIQQDLGSAIVIAAFSVVFLFLANEKRRVAGIGGLFLILLTIIGFFSIGLVRTRLTNWIIPWAETQSGSYQVIQSVIAIAAGGIVGTGIGLGSPSLVPLAHSDFIFAAIAEETGLVGSIALIGLFLFLISRGLFIAKITNNQFHRLLAGGVCILLSIQTILIMGGNTRLLPITGITLPLVSYGGSSLFISFFLAILLLVLSPSSKIQAVSRKRSVTIKLIFLIIICGFIAIAASYGWWAVIRGRELLLRIDNARIILADSFVPRGSIYDRNGVLLVESIGDVGSLTRKYFYPSLSNILGFDSPRYGRAGIESGLNDYLRGNTGYPASTQWLQNLITNQPLKGLDVRLTIDATIQTRIDNALIGRKGGVAVINAANGEILALSSSPTFDANQLEQEYQSLIDDSNAPFVDRATQSQYPAGGLIAPLALLGSTEDQVRLLQLTNPSSISECTQSSLEVMTFETGLSIGCIDTSILTIYANNIITPENTLQKLRLPTFINGFPVSPFSFDPTQTRLQMVEGISQIRSNPLQIAYAYSVFSNSGNLPTLKILDATKNPTGMWVITSESQEQVHFSERLVFKIQEMFAAKEIPGWELAPQTVDSNGTYGWYIAGLDNTSDLNPLVIAVVLENEPSSISAQIGRSILLELISSK